MIIPAETTSVSMSIDVPNLVEAIGFYTNAFGFTECSAPAPGLAVLHAGNTKICLLEKQAGTRASTHTEETRRYERHWTPVHLDIHVGDLEAALARALDAGAKKEHVFENAKHGSAAFCSDPFGHGSVSYRETDSRVGQAQGGESFPTVSPTPLESANWGLATGLLGRKPCGSGTGTSAKSRDVLRKSRCAAKRTCRQQREICANNSTPTFPKQFGHRRVTPSEHRNQHHKDAGTTTGPCRTQQRRYCGEHPQAPWQSVRA